MMDHPTAEKQVTLYQLASEELIPVLERFGFETTSVESHCIRFESDRVHLTLSYGLKFPEVRLGVGLLNEVFNGRERPFFLDEIVRLADPTIDSRNTLCQASTLDRLRNALSRISTMLVEYGSDALLGRYGKFKELASLRDRECAEYKSEMELRAARPRADAAWKEKDYGKYVTIMQPFFDYLTASETKKLVLAKKRSPGE